ncbi:MAG: hypothetical protein WCA31_08065 [Acidimicrobiales bacterium]
MLKGSHRFSNATRGVLAGAAIAGALALSVGVFASSSSALGNSPFCKTLFTYEEQDASKATPPSTWSGYRAWAAELVPFYEKLASEAPNTATKNTLNEVVTILKWESKKESIKSLEAYVAANHLKFENGTKALAKAVESCA